MSKPLTILMTLGVLGLWWGLPRLATATDRDLAGLDSLVTASPDDVVLRVIAGQAWLQTAAAGDDTAIARAEAHLDRALELAPDDPQVLVLHGTMLTLKGRQATEPALKMRHVADGLQEMDRAVELAPMDVAIRYRRGTTCLRLPLLFDRAGTAVEDFSHLLAMTEQASERPSAEEIPQLKLSLAEAHRRNGDLADARQLLRALIADSPDSLIAEDASRLLATLDD
jgi:predicted Zn-dependent protease